jgi:2,3-bisphosphoglycerate-independent phosphoglycerate mutase
MKYLILVPDGCADWAVDELGGKTPLDVAEIENINALAKRSVIGLTRTVPEGVEPGSDVANLAILGFDPESYLTGRAPLEAVAAGIEMDENDIAFRVNLVTLDAAGDSYENFTIKSHSAGDITDAEAEILMDFLNKELAGDFDVKFYPGISYRCSMMARFGEKCNLSAPHDFLEQKAGIALPKGDGAAQLEDLMRRSFDLLKNHPVNTKRIASGLLPANSIWFWGQGKKPALPSFKEKYGLTGSVVTAVNLIRGIGLCLGLSVVEVEGTLGTVDTNYEGEAQATIDEFKKGKDFVFLHVEAPDECSHNGDLQNKLLSMKYIDQRMFKTVLSYLENCGEPYRILILPDHFTPVKIRKHTGEPVPYVMFDSEKILPADDKKALSEAAGKTGQFFASGREMAECFFQLGTVK